MALFAYKAVSPSGDIQQGEMEGRHTEGVAEDLQRQGLLPIHIYALNAQADATGGLSFLSRPAVKESQILEATSQIAILLKAGLQLDKSLDILIQMSANPAMADMLTEVRDDVRGGMTFSAAIEKKQRVFGRFYINMVKAGEAGGSLGHVMERIADFMERAREIRAIVSSALFYPLILLCVSAISVLILLTWVVPKFQAMFEGTDKALPVPTQIVISSAEFIKSYWWFIPMVIVGVVFAYRSLLSNPATRLRWDAWRLRWPLFGPLFVKIEVARLTRTLGTLLSNGVPLLGALSIAKETMGNQLMVVGMDEVVGKLRDGSGFSRPLQDTGLFPPMAVQMVKVGEETGEMEIMLNRVADVYDREVQTAVKKLLALMEPVMIICLAMVIAFIIISILLGIMSVNDLAG